jgi:TolB-like protein/Flp pilus assembly protein TadD
MSEDSANQVSVGRDVFVSYASQDAAVADAIVAALEKNGIRCWIAPRNVTPGALYADGIIRAINEAKVMVLVLSASAIASKHVGKEVERTSSKGRPIIALKVDAAPLTTTLEYFLSESQWIDAAALGISAATAKLTQAVRQALAAPSGGTPMLATNLGASGPAAANRQIGKRPIALAGGLIALVVAVGLAIHFWPSKQGNAQAPAIAIISDKSIAVLPFTDMSEKKDQEYFADGMAEEIIDLMARIPGLKVIGRTSSFQFKGHNEDLRTVGAKLGVAYVLEGSVRKSGDRVRVTAQLIEVRDGSHRWSGTYDRDLVDVLKVQDEISVGLVRALQLSMGADEPRAVIKNGDGYTLYLRGRQAFNRMDKAGFDQAASYFRQAMQLDPESALVPAWLAFVDVEQAAYGFVKPDMGFEEARRYAERARALDPRSELAAGVFGVVHLYHDWDWAGAATELDRALALAPGNARMLLFHSEASFALGHWDSAIRDLSAAGALDPLYAAAYELLGEAHLRAGNWSEAEAAFNRALDIAPHYALVHMSLATTLLLKGDTPDALRQIDLEPDETAQWAGRAVIYHALGRQGDSDAALKRLTELAPANWAYSIACVHAYRGESDAAFLWLERAFMQRDTDLWLIKSEPLLRPLHGDLRFKAFLKKMNLPE